MPKMNISRDIVIDASPDKVHEVVADFHTWPSWSPWLIAEPEAKVDVRADGKHYTWQGNRVGEGMMDVKSETPQRIDYALEFLKPWKSKADVAFHLKEEQGKTRVTWTMNSGWPFFLFFMKKKTEAFIGMDYERGLSMLKAKIENGQVPSKLSFDRGTFDGCKYVGIKRSIPMKQIGDQMGKDLSDIYGHIKQSGGAPTGAPFSQYHKWDMVNGEVSYTIGMPTNDDIPGSGELFVGDLPAFKYAKVRHQGPYEHLGNAWSTIMMMQRNKEFKQNKRIHPVEFYLNDPSQTAPEELITDVCMPVKG